MILKIIFRWIYCLDYHEALILLALFTALFHDVRAKLSRRRFWAPAVAAALLAWAAAVVIQTVFQRDMNSALEPVWQPFRSYIDALGEGGQRELLRSNFMNALLFYPAGLLLASLLPERWKAAAKVTMILVLFALFSAGIEYVQYRYCLGLAQTDDVIHNALGAAVGAFVSAILPGIIGKKRILKRRG